MENSGEKREFSNKTDGQPKKRLGNTVLGFINTITGKRGRELARQEEIQKANMVETFIIGGIDRIREQRYEEAITYFQNEQVAQQAGLDFDNSAKVRLIDHAPAGEELDDLMLFIGWHSHGGLNPSTGRIVIKIAGIVSTSSEPVEIPAVINHYWALTSAEEWLHALQDLRKEPIAGFKDQELDVVSYFVKHGLRLEDMPDFEFKRRWQNREALKERLSKPD